MGVNMRLIDADEIIKETWGVVIKDMFHMDETVEVISRKDIDNAPTIDAEPVRHGHWIFNPKDAIEMMFTLPKCSECGAESPNGGNYCPNCGAKMDGERE